MAQQVAEKHNPEQKTMNNPFEMAADNFKMAMEAGMKFQESAFKSMTQFTTGGETFEDNRKRVETMATDSIDMVRKNAEQAEKCFDEGCKNGMDMIRKSFDSMKNEDKDIVARTCDMWQNAFDVMRNNVETAAKVNVQTIENVSSFFKKNANGARKAQ